QILTVLSPAERHGDFSELLPTKQLVDPSTGNPYPNNQVPVNPISQAYIDRYLPVPNLPGNQFISAPVGRIRDDQVIARVDHHASARDTVSLLYMFDDNSDFFPFQVNLGAATGGNVPVGSGFSDATRSQVGSITWTHTLSPTFLNEARVAMN